MRFGVLFDGIDDCLWVITEFMLRKREDVIVQGLFAPIVELVVVKDMLSLLEVF
jgi:hypothetical protein